MQSGKRILLLDIGDTQIDTKRTLKTKRLVWNGGSSRIWKLGIQAVKEAGAAEGLEIECGIATLLSEPDILSAALEMEMATEINPRYVYYDTERSLSKIDYALSRAAEDTADKRQVCIIEDQDEVCREAEEAGFATVCAKGLIPQVKSESIVLQQQLAIIDLFQRVIREFGLKASSKLEREQSLVRLAILSNTVSQPSSSAAKIRKMLSFMPSSPPKKEKLAPVKQVALSKDEEPAKNPSRKLTVHRDKREACQILRSERNHPFLRPQKRNEKDSMYTGASQKPTRKK